MAKKPQLTTVDATLAININDRVRVKLTKHGREVYRQYWLDRGHNLGSIQEPTVLEDQLWVIMCIFGPVMRLGMSPVFEDGCIHYVTKAVIGFK